MHKTIIKIKTKKIYIYISSLYQRLNERERKEKRKKKKRTDKRTDKKIRKQQKSIYT